MSGLLENYYQGISVEQGRLATESAVTMAYPNLTAADADVQTHDRRRSPPRAEHYTYAMMWHRGEMSRRTRCRSSRVAHPIYGRTSFYRSSLVARPTTVELLHLRQRRQW